MAMDCQGRECHVVWKRSEYGVGSFRQWPCSVAFVQGQCRQKERWGRGSAGLLNDNFGFGELVRA